MLRGLSSFIFCVLIIQSNVFSNLIPISPEEMQARKVQTINKILTHPILSQDPLYKRAILTISCDDSDFIPKVANAGEIVVENNRQCQVMHSGIKVLKNCYYGDSSDWSTEIIYALRGHHEPQEEKVFHEVLSSIKPDSVMIELGSYWAYYSIWFASQVPNAATYLIEPNSKNLEIGRENFKINHCTYTHEFIHGYAGNHYGESREENLQHIIIDNFMRDRSIQRVAILHADIQGEELNMLRRCQRSLITRKIDYLFISTHGDDIHALCLNFLKKFGYHILAEHNCSESFSVDGLIVARSPLISGEKSISISKRTPRVKK